MNKPKSLLILSFLLLIALVSCNRNTETSDAFGNFEATETIVSSLASGQLIQLNLEEGDLLEANQTIGMVDTIDLSLKKAQMLSQKSAVLSRLSAVNAQLEVNKQQLQNSRIDQQRIYKLFADGAATQKQKDDIDGAVKLIEKQMMATQSQAESIHSEAVALDSQVAQVNESIRKAMVINPIKGVVLNKYAEAGEVVGFGKSLYKIADLSTLELRVYVTGSQLSKFAIGDEVVVLIDKTKEKTENLSGKISWVSATAEFTPKTIQTREERVDLVYAVKVRIANDGRLKIGMPGEIRFKH
jgi:HlyD family secretion protein